MALPAFRKFNIPRESLWFQAPVLGVSALLCLIVTIVYWVQPDSWAALLVCPRWIWPVFGLMLALLGWTRKSKLAAGLVVVLWLLYAVTFVEEVSSLIRWRRWPSTAWQSAHNNGAAIRVVSLNCEGGNEDAAAEVIRFKPDIVLFEESPVRPKLQALTEKLVGPDGEALCGPDVSLMARGKITPLPIPEPWNIPFSHARVELASGLKLEVVVVRLLPYDISVDLWSPDCWRRQRENRERQRRQIEWLAHRIESIPRDVPVIVGGDFNQPCGDRLLRVLKPRLKDTFRKAGTGWGDTLANNIPVLRVDQIWTSDHFQPASVVARRTVNSDHRMVVCDLLCLRDSNEH